MPRPRPEKSHGGSRDVSGDESDAHLDPTSSGQARRTRKRPAHSARDSSADHTGSQSAPRSQERVANVSSVAAEQRHEQASGHRSVERRIVNGTAQGDLSANPSSFETPNQARDRLALMQSSSSNSTTTARSTIPHRSARNTRSNLEQRLTSNDPAQQDSRRTTSLMARSISNQSFSSRYFDDSASQTTSASDDFQMRNAHALSQHADSGSFGTVPGPLTIRTQNIQPQASTANDTTAPMARTNSNMSPPRPTRSLPRRRASARTQNRPLLSSNNSASSSSHGLRSRSSSNSNILAPSNSTANILASGQHNRQNSLTGCLPLGGGFDPSFNPPSGMSTPRTPLAEIPLWLADMRSESRRSSTSSSTLLDREDLLNMTRSVSTRHARTVSTSSSSGPTSPGMTRNGSTSPVVPFRRSLRGRRPRESDENARISPSPSYFGEYDTLPSPSAASFTGQWTPFDESMDPNTSLSSSMTQLGTSSPSMASVPLQPGASPAMSTRSRTLHRAGSVRTRRLTNPLNTPVSVDSLGLPYEAMRVQHPEHQSAFHQARSNAQERRTRTNEEQRTATLLERRAAAAAAAATGVVPAASHVTTRASSRPSSRTSSPARGTRASRRRSTAAEVASSSVLENTALGPRPGSLAPLQIPGGRLARETRLVMPGQSTLSSAILEASSNGLVAAVYGPHAASQEPISPSAFSEMTTLTQGSSASESINSVGGMPVTPSSIAMTQDPFAQSVIRTNAGSSQQTRRARAAAGEDAEGDITLGTDQDDSLSSRVLRQTLSQRKQPQSSRDADVDQEALGVQLRPRP